MRQTTKQAQLAAYNERKKSLTVTVTPGGETEEEEDVLVGVFGLLRK